MERKVILHQTLQDLYAQMGISMEQEVEFTIDRIEDIHGQDPITSPVFRANYYSFLFIVGGHGYYTLDEQEFEVLPYTIYFTNPGHLKSFRTTKPYHGFILTFSEDFLKSHVRADIFEDFPFLLAETVPPGYLEKEKFVPYLTLLEQMWSEKVGTSPYKYDIIANLFVVLLLKIKARFWFDYDPRNEADRGSKIVHLFRQALEQTFRELAIISHLPNVQDYADQQQLHPNYFNTVIKTKTGKSAHTWITEKTIAEAKALLTHTDTSVKEIAYQLKFAQPTHFSKFFKKYTEQTPVNYRKGL
ncbi:MAG: AraC family transcriptional regulator [Bacteroidota bacterium]